MVKTGFFVAMILLIIAVLVYNTTFFQTVPTTVAYKCIPSTDFSINSKEVNKITYVPTNTSCNFAEIEISIPVSRITVDCYAGKGNCQEQSAISPAYLINVGNECKNYMTNFSLIRDGQKNLFKCGGLGGV